MKKSKSASTKIILNSISFVLRIFLNIIFYVFVVILVTRLSTAAFDFAYQLYGNVAVEEAPGTDVTVQVKKGESMMVLARKLEYNHVVLNKYSFYIRARLTLSDKRAVLPGTYLLNSSMNYEQILNTLTDHSTDKKELK